MAKKASNDGSMGFLDWFKGNGPEETPAKPTGKSNDDLIKEIEGLNKRLDDQDRRLSEARSTVSQPSVEGIVLPEAPMLDLTGLPDPFQYPEEYSKAYSKRNSDFVKATMAFEKAQDTAAHQADNQFYTKAGELWNDFQAAYPDYSKNPKIVRFATAEVTERIARSGGDVAASMFGNRTQFMKDVVKEIESTVGKPAVAVEEEEPADRTGGLFGGSGSTTSNTGNEGKSDMLQDLRDIQIAQKLY